MSTPFPYSVKMTRRVHVPLHAHVTYFGDENGSAGASIQLEDTSTKQYNRFISLNETGAVEVDHLFTSPDFRLAVGVSRVAGATGGTTTEVHGNVDPVRCYRLLDTYGPSAEMILREVREQLETYRVGGVA